MLQIISIYIGIVIMMIGVLAFGFIVLDEKPKISKKKLILTLLIICIFHTIIYLNFTGTVKTIISCVINIILYKYIFKVSNQKSIMLTFLYMIMLLIPELIEILFVTKVLEISPEYCIGTFAGSLISNLVVCILFVIITFFLRKILKKLVDTQIENNVKIIIFSILIFILIGIFFYSGTKELRYGKNILVYLISIIVLLTVLFSLIKQTVENNKLTKKYDKLLEFMKTFEKEVEKQRVLRHETKNEFLSIKARINDKQDNKEIIKYIDEILKDKITVKQEEYAKFGYLPANGIKGLCYFKVQEAQDKGLNTSINISKRIENSNIYNLNIKEQRNLGKILGVFLDNAIEASLKSTNKKIGIEAYLNIHKECQIIISNSYDEELNTDKIGKERFSTKGKNRGHGLLLVKHIVDNNKIFETKSEVTEELYIQKIIIRKEV